jgi:hypothetical protein
MNLGSIIAQNGGGGLALLEDENEQLRHFTIAPSVNVVGTFDLAPIQHLQPGRAGCFSRGGRILGTGCG